MSIVWSSAKEAPIAPPILTVSKAAARILLAGTQVVCGALALGVAPDREEASNLLDPIEFMTSLHV